MIRQRLPPEWWVKNTLTAQSTLLLFLHKSSKVEFTAIVSQDFRILFSAHRSPGLWRCAIALRIAAAVLLKEKSLCVHTKLIHCARRAPSPGLVVTEDIHLFFFFKKMHFFASLKGVHFRAVHCWQPQNHTEGAAVPYDFSECPFNFRCIFRDVQFSGV